MSEQGFRRVDTRSVRRRFLALKALGLVYSWSGKRSNGFAGEHGKKGIDCSGLVEDALAEVPGMDALQGEPSTGQLDKLEALDFERVPYVQAWKHFEPNAVYVAGWNRGGRGRHIILVQNGRTMESRTPDGPGSHDAGSDLLRTHVQRCFRLS